MSEIYLDNSATTKMSEGAITKMNEVICTHFGNPSSLHKRGLDAEHILSEAREIIGKSLGIRALTRGEIIFTSGGTEANNLAILGGVFSKSRKGNEVILTTQGEHSSVEEPMTYLEGLGYKIVRVPTKKGQLDLDFIRQNAYNVVLASFMHVNNETGAVYDLESAFEVIREKSSQAILHADCVQSYLKVKFTKQRLGADLISISGHKVNGPKGIGALYVDPQIIKAKKLVPILLGGGQEENLRSGTENVYAIAGFGQAVKEHFASLDTEISQMSEVSSYLIDKLSSVSGVSLNLPENRVCHIVNITVKGIRSETLLHYLSSKEIYVSSGSACSSHSKKGRSRALTSFGLSPLDIDSAIRISLNPHNTTEEIDILVNAVDEAIKRLAKR
ncbi:MAG: cysteine desulfurase [Clostridia bacterium]|nr:cysteine desulfurase [Clostridia bacterium]